MHYSELVVFTIYSLISTKFQSKMKKEIKQANKWKNSSETNYCLIFMVPNLRHVDLHHVDRLRHVDLRLYAPPTPPPPRRSALITRTIHTHLLFTILVLIVVDFFMTYLYRPGPTSPNFHPNFRSNSSDDFLILSLHLEDLF